MDKMIVSLVLTMEEVDRLLQKLDMLGDDPDSRHLQQRIFSQQYPPEVIETPKGTYTITPGFVELPERREIKPEGKYTPAKI